MRRISCFVFLLPVLCVLGASQGAARDKRTKNAVKDRALCHLIPDPGPCDSKVRRWFYNSATDECMTFIWTGCDGNANRFRSRGQCERKCRDLGPPGEDEDGSIKTKSTPTAKCRKMPCKGLRCRHGYNFGLDENGCQTCQCRSFPPLTTTALAQAIDTCPEVDCPGRFCPRGFQLDDRGCMTCECVGCPRLNCPSHLSCNHGYVTDERTGCQVCECSAHAPGGLVGRKSVRKCGVDPSHCTSVCPEGRVLDSERCETCQCLTKKESKMDTSGATLREDKRCDVSGLVTCALKCPGGYDKDPQGCETCECRPLSDEDSPPGLGHQEPCHPLNEDECAERCEIFVIRRDENDCEFCYCAGDHEVTTVASGSECPLVAMCTLYCPEGLARDEYGCETCQCRETSVTQGVQEENRNIGLHSSQEHCPHIECYAPCRLLSEYQGDCPVCHCDDQIIYTTPAQPLCLDLDCGEMSCPEGFQLDQNGCQLCACIDDTHHGTHPFEGTTDNPSLAPGSEYEKYSEEQEDPQPFTSWRDSVTVVPAKLDPAEEWIVSPAEVMCNARPCGKRCSNGLRRSEWEECYHCECNHPDGLEGHRKRLVDLSVFNARKGICSRPAYTGPCQANITRWYFNFHTENCETFQYGGCRGYANNFGSESSCHEFCLPEINRDRATRQEWVKKVLGL